MRIKLTTVAMMLLAVCRVLAQEQNRVLELNGSGDYVELPAGVLGNYNTITIEAWVNWRAFGGPLKRVINYGTPNRDISLAERNGGDLWLVFPEDQRHFHEVATRTLVSTNQWVHLAGVVGQGGMKLYLNGWLMGTEPYNGGANKTLPNALFRIGDRITLNDPPTAFVGA